ncbi:DUF4157 domain-containing protein [Dendronalium sp. ChiSLP03b]|uniref:eCIS core domain-containing protein n=1 Tax=Dendronalium sp. ChiSLP03b TaxID=3075381 RepID=UPI002AD4DFA9|nr:DUF4157 domain-containing protein [Dendronalium sp. ChiSLP03b]MDZ8204175.1 DUF4157 domain-containing protein [Dendronalium sp. ChiSLP03b]
MYSRQHKIAKTAKSSDISVSNQFAPRGFVVQPQLEEVSTQQQETLDLQAESAREKQFGNGLPDVSIFTRNLTSPSTPRLQMKLNIGQSQTVQRHQEESDKELQMKPDVQRHQEEDELQMKPNNSSYLQRHGDMPEEDEAIQRRVENNGSFDAGNNLESRIRNQSSGQPLDAGVRAFMEPRFGHSFADIRVHTNSEAVQMNKELHAQAFTNGQHIYFNEGKYNPNSGSGKELLAHELTHTIQQTGGHSLQRQVEANSCNVGCQCSSCLPTSSTIQRQISLIPSSGTQDLLSRRLTDVVQRHADAAHSRGCQCSNCSATGIQIQTKLTVGAPGDRYEQEADQIAAQVMRMPEPQQADSIQRHEERHATKPSTTTDSVRVGRDRLQRQAIAHPVSVQQSAPNTIQRHSAYEHYLLGQVEPSQLANIPMVREIPQLEKQLDTLTKQIEKENSEENWKQATLLTNQLEEAKAKKEDVKHTLMQEMDRLVKWKDNPKAVEVGKTVTEKGEAAQDADTEIVEKGKVKKGKDDKWQVPYVIIPCQDGEIVATYSEINTLPDLFGNPEAIAKTPKANVFSLLQGVRQQSYIELDNIYKELFGQSRSELHNKVKVDDDFTQAQGPRAQAVVNKAYEVRTESQVNDATFRQGDESEAYFAALERNACHFAPESWTSWERYHTKARELANLALNGKRFVQKAQDMGLPDAAAQLEEEVADYTNQALLQNAFGEHYLQDSFAAGHLINKTKIMQWFVAWLNKQDKGLGTFDEAESDWAMVSSIASEDLQSNPQALHDRIVRGEIVSFEQLNTAMGAQVKPEIVFMMWWRNAAAQHGSMKHLTPDEAAEYCSISTVQGNSDAAETLMQALVSSNFAKEKVDKTLGNKLSFGKAGKAKAVYSLDEAQVNVVKAQGGSPYKSKVAQQAEDSEQEHDFEAEAEEFNAVAYNSFLSNAYVQGATKFFHDKYCKEGLKVYSRGGEYLHMIYGDNNMMKAGGQKGVQFSAETSQMSREAIFNIVNGESDKAASIDTIKNRFPGYAIDEGATLPLDKWNEMLKARGEAGLFKKAMDNGALTVYKKQKGISKGHAMDYEKLTQAIESEAAEAQHDEGF